MQERPTLTYLRCSKLLVASAFFLVVVTVSYPPVWQGLLCMTGVQVLDVHCWFTGGSWRVFLYIRSDVENPALSWPLLPTPFLVTFNLQTFCNWDPLSHSPSGRHLQEGFAPPIFFVIYLMENNLNVFANKMVGNADILWLSRVFPTTFSLPN